MQQYENRSSAFTLAELLIALAILGIIATFSIPKILQAQQDQRYNAAAKEAAAMISQSYAQYMNYISTNTVSTIDDVYGSSATVGCTFGNCLHLPNGGIFRTWLCNSAGTASTNAVGFFFDPDGFNSGTTNGPAKSIKFILYYNGRLTTYGTVVPGTVNACETMNPDPTVDPPWFHWN